MTDNRGDRQSPAQAGFARGPFTYIEHELQVSCSCGGGKIAVDDGDLERCRRDPDQFAADHIGIGRADFDRWQEALQTTSWPRCAATTKRGTPCTQTVAWACRDTRPHGWGSDALRAEALWFLANDRAHYCRLHGGGAS